MKKTYILLMLGLMLIISGCSSPKPPVPEVEQKELPAWFLTPPSNNEIYLYGIGEGKNQEQAVKNALNNLAERLSVTVQSSYEVNTQIQQGIRNSFSQSSERNLKSEVAKIRISNYSIDKAEKMKYNHYIVLIRSDKEQFYNSLVKELDVKIKKVNDESKIYKSANILKKYDFYKNASQNLNDSITTILVLSALNSEFNDKKYLNEISAINKDFEELRKKINFVVSGDKESSAMIEPVRVALTDNGLKVVNQKNSSSVIVKISTRSEEAAAMGFIVARMVVNIEVKTADGKTVGGNKLMINGHSPQSYSQAKENGAKKLKGMIEKEGINTILGLKL